MRRWLLAGVIALVCLVLTSPCWIGFIGVVTVGNQLNETYGVDYDG